VAVTVLRVLRDRPAWSVGTGLQLSGALLSIDPALVAGTSVTSPRIVATTDLGWSTARCGAHNLQATDFQPTTSAMGILRDFDEFGSNQAGGKIGAAIHPYNGATPVEFACYFQAALGSPAAAAVRADLWKIPVGGVGTGQVIASVQLDGGVVTLTPIKVSQTTVVGGPLVTFDGANGFTYLVELSFGAAYPTFKASGCFLRWCADTVSP